MISIAYEDFKLRLMCLISLGIVWVMPKKRRRFDNSEISSPHSSVPSNPSEPSDESEIALRTTHDISLRPPQLKKVLMSEREVKSYWDQFVFPILASSLNQGAEPGQLELRVENYYRNHVPYSYNMIEFPSLGVFANPDREALQERSGRTKRRAGEDSGRKRSAKKRPKVITEDSEGSESNREMEKELEGEEEEDGEGEGPSGDEADQFMRLHVRRKYYYQTEEGTSVLDSVRDGFASLLLLTYSLCP
jgi:hypothetical protein